MVEEHDIDIGTELQPSASDSLPPAEPAPSEPVAVYSAVGADNSEPRVRYTQTHTVHIISIFTVHKFFLSV